MKNKKYTFKLSIFLLGMSFVLYMINYLMFRDLHHILTFVTEDLAFIPIEVLVTVVIIDRVLEIREKKKKEQKINLLIEVFFEEVGNELLCKIASKDKKCCEIGCIIPRDGEMLEWDYKKIKEAIEQHHGVINFIEDDIDQIYKLLVDNKELFIKFLENPYLMEHDRLTDLLQSVSHFYHEIRFRRKNGAFTKEDMEHLRSDVLRVYKYLSEEWLVYIEYIQKEYPFLFNLAIKNVPFNESNK